jgi:hypothetical protein
MADDQPRPSENDNQDAETDPTRTANADRESSTAADGAPDFEPETEPDAESEPESGVETEPEVDAESEPESSEETDTGEDAAEYPEDEAPGADEEHAAEDVPSDVRKYERFTKMDGAEYDRVNEFLRERTYITAREWAIARLCADFRTETGVEMTKIGENLPELVPFMTDTYSPQAVNQARSSFEDKVQQAGATFLYGAMSGFFTAEELDDTMYEVTEVAKFLLEVEGVDLSVEEELEAEDRISGVMREVRSASEQLRHDELECPHCGHEMEAADADANAEADD